MTCVLHDGGCMQTLSLSVTPEEAETIYLLREIHPSNRDRIMRLIRRLNTSEHSLHKEDR